MKLATRIISAEGSPSDIGLQYGTQAKDLILRNIETYQIQFKRFAKIDWEKVKEYQDIIYEKWEGIAKITINRPEVRNAFRPETVNEMHEAFDNAREDPDVGVILLTGKNPVRDGKYAFCSGGDQKIRLIGHPIDQERGSVPCTAD